MSLDWTLCIIGILLFVGVLAGRASGIFGVPALLLFLTIGMLAGSEGPGGIYFNSPGQAQNVGVVALAFILFSGGMDSEWRELRPLLKMGLSLATVGVVVTTGLVALFAHYVLGWTLLEGVLIGSIVSSTDAAAVFALVQGQRAPFRKKIVGLLELESGTNDPLAVFLTVTCISFLQDGSGGSALSVVGHLAWEMVAGATFGYLIGRLGVVLMRKMELQLEGLYHVLSLVFVLISYSGAALIGASGFLSVYVAGVTYGNGSFDQFKGLRRFHDGVAWLMQIAMFLVMGLLAFPSHLLSVALPGLALALFLMVAARPIGVVLSLLPFRMKGREVALIGWTGMRGAVPIVLATYPRVAGLSHANELFNLVFFVVLMSALFQGTTTPLLARKLGLLEKERDMEPALTVQASP